MRWQRRLTKSAHRQNITVARARRAVRKSSTVKVVSTGSLRKRRVNSRSSSAVYILLDGHLRCNTTELKWLRNAYASPYSQTDPQQHKRISLSLALSPSPPAYVSLSLSLSLSSNRWTPSVRHAISPWEREGLIRKLPAFTKKHGNICSTGIATIRFIVHLPQRARALALQAHGPRQEPWSRAFARRGHGTLSNTRRQHATRCPLAAAGTSACPASPSATPRTLGASVCPAISRKQLPARIARMRRSVHSPHSRIFSKKKPKPLALFWRWGGARV